MSPKIISRLLLAIFFMGAGILHFTATAMYVKIMPPYLPFPTALVYISGGFEILGGIGIAIPFLQRYAAYGLIALCLAIFPANINMVVNYSQIGLDIPLYLLWLRLPLQFLLIYWIWWSAELSTLRRSPSPLDSEPTAPKK